MAKQDNFVRTQVRLEPDLYEAIKNAAGDRSMNETIQALLWVALAQHGDDTQLAARVAKLEQRIEDMQRQLDQLTPRDGRS